jgi:uncharacterized LabA/DUF88 family protein
MLKKQNNYAFIDSQNVNLAIRAQGWKLDWARFRVHLRETYSVQVAYLFIGFVDGNTSLYADLQDAGFVCIFKPTLVYADGTTKGNCDAELVMHAMIQYPHFDKAIIATGDGDFHCLVQHFLQQEKLEVLLVPNKKRFSALLRMEEFRKHTHFMNNLQDRLEYKKRPKKDAV